MNGKGKELRLEYPAIFAPDRTGGFVITFPDFPEIATQGDTCTDAIHQSIDALEEAVAERIALKEEIPTPSRIKKGQQPIPLSPSAAISAAVYMGMRGRKMSQVQMAAKLGINEKQVRRMLDPYHGSRLTGLEDALQALGKRVVISIEDIEPAASILN